MNNEELKKQFQLLQFDTEPKAEPQKKQAPEPVQYRCMRDSYVSAKGVISKHMASIEDTIGTIEKGDYRHIVSFGSWSVEHYIAHALKQCGPMHLAAVTWSIASGPIMQICNSIRAKEILSCRMVFDYRMRRWREDAYERQSLLEMGQMLNIRLAHSHAKIYLLWNDNYHLTFSGSANITTNPRVEQMVMHENEELLMFHLNWIDALFERSDPFDFNVDKK